MKDYLKTVPELTMLETVTVQALENLDQLTKEVAELRMFKEKSEPILKLPYNTLSSFQEGFPFNTSPQRFQLSSSAYSFSYISSSSFKAEFLGFFLISSLTLFFIWAFVNLGVDFSIFYNGGLVQSLRTFRINPNLFRLGAI